MFNLIIHILPSPRPHYSARPKCFGSRGPIENVSFPDRSPRIRHRNELTERDWENAVQGPGKYISILCSIDRCQNRVSADQCRMTVSRAQVPTHCGHVLFDVFRLASHLALTKSMYYFHNNVQERRL